MAEATLTNRPLYNHVLSAESCLSEESSIFQMDMSTVTISMLEVPISIGNINHNCHVMDSKETTFITRELLITAVLYCVIVLPRELMSVVEMS